MSNIVKVTPEMLTEIANEIKKVDANIPNQGYMCHGEWHDYKPSIKPEQMVDIMAKKLGVDYTIPEDVQNQIDMNMNPKRDPDDESYR